MLDALRGLRFDPMWTGLLRGVVEAAAMAALVTLALFLTAAPPAALVPFVPVLLFIIRWLEGLADQIDPAKARGPQAE